MFRSVVTALTCFEYESEKEDTLEDLNIKNSGVKLSKYKADTFDMIQNVLEENNMARATVYNI